MAEKIVLAGATGDLGTRIARALFKRGADVVALARIGAPDDKVQALKSLGAKVRIVDMASVSDIAKACDGLAYANARRHRVAGRYTRHCGSICNTKAVHCVSNKMALYSASTIT